MKTLYIGIDPGASGAWAELWPDGKVCIGKFDDPAAIRDNFEIVGQIIKKTAWDKYEGFEHVTIALEQVGGYVGKQQPGSAMFKFGQNFGWWQGLLMGVRLPFMLVRPQEWQKGIPNMHGKKGPDRKRALRDYAAMLYPNQKVTLNNADALLIAAWAKNNKP